MDSDKITCGICGNSIIKYLQTIHEAKCRIEQGLKNKLNTVLGSGSGSGIGSTNNIQRDDSQEISKDGDSQTGKIIITENKGSEQAQDDFIQNIMNRIRMRKEEIRTNLEFNFEKKAEDESTSNKAELKDQKDDAIIDKDIKEGVIVKEENLKMEEKQNYNQSIHINELKEDLGDSGEAETLRKSQMDNIENMETLIQNHNNSDNDNLSEKAVDIEDNKEDEFKVEVEENIINKENTNTKNEGQELHSEHSESELHKEVNDSIVLGSTKLFSNEKVQQNLNENENENENKENTSSNNSSLKKKENIINPILDQSIISTKTNININQNYNQILPTNQQYNPPTTTNNINGNPPLSNKYTPNPTSIDEQLLQKIEETQMEKQKEAQQTLEEIQAIEANLKLDERLMHEKWQIRKNAYKEVGDLITCVCEQETNQTSPERVQLFETFSPWLKYFISDNNVIALAEGLNTFHIFMTNAPEYRSKAMIEFFDELEKILTYSKVNINDVCYKIINTCLSSKKMLNFTFNELIKKMSTTNSKMLNFIQKIFLELIISNPTETNQNYLRMLLEKSILYYSSSSKSIERKKVFAKFIQDIYSVIEDEFEVIKRNVNMTNQKDIEKVMKGVKKKSDGKRLILYQETYSHTINRDNESSPKEKKVISNFIQDNQDESGGVNKKTPAEVNDLVSVFPDDFFQLTYSTQFNQKKEILEKTNKILSQVIGVKDKDKDYREILSNLGYAIDDSNVLVHSEGIKCLGHIARLLKMNVNQSKMKLLLQSCFDKFKDKKSLVKIELYNLFDTLLSNFCFTGGYFINFTLTYLISQKNPIIRQCLLEYIKSLFTQEEDSEEREHKLILQGVINSVENANYLSFSKLLADIILNETQSNIKDLCTDLIMIFKQKVVSTDKNAAEKFKKIIDSLPSHRKNMISSGKSNYNTNTDEKEYKASLKRVKSNLSFRTGNSTSLSRDKRESRSNMLNSSNVSDYESKGGVRGNKSNLSVSKERSLSKGKMNTLKNKLGAGGKESNNNKTESKIKNEFEKKKKELIDKMMKKKTLSSADIINSNKENNIRIVKAEEEDKNEHSEEEIDNTYNNSNSNSNKSTNTQVNSIKIPPTRTIELSESQRTTTTNISMLEKRMESAIEHIYSLDKPNLFEYTKKVIKDFLIFVKNVTSKKLQEDLESHFQVIINILEKIWDRINAFQRGRKGVAYNHSSSIPDELFIQSLKVVVVAPCFIDSAENGKGRIYRKYLLPFMELLRSLVNNDEKLFYFYLDIINKFINFDNKGTSFLENVNPRATFLAFIDYFLADSDSEEFTNFDLKKMNVIETIVDVIRKSPFLSEYEKHQYLSKFPDIKDQEEENIEVNNTEMIMESERKDLDYNNKNNNFPRLESSLIQNIKSDRDEYNQNNNSNDRDNITEISQIQTNQNEDASNINIDLNQDEEWKIKYRMQLEENEKLKERLNLLSKQRVDKENENSEMKREVTQSTQSNKEINNTPSYTDNYGVPISMGTINNDIADIKDKINQKVRKLDMTIKRLGSKIDKNTENTANPITNNKESRKVMLDESLSNEISILNANNNTNNYNSNSHVKNKQIRSLQDFYEEENEDVSDNNSNNNPHSSNKNQLTNQNNQLNNLLMTNPLIKQEDEIKNLILKIPSNLLDNNIGEIAVYVKLESIFHKLNSEKKLSFTKELYTVLENNSLIKTSSFNCFLQLFEFLLNLLSQEIIIANNPQYASNISLETLRAPMLQLQEVIESLMRKKDISEVFKVMIYLLRKFLPKNFEYAIDRESLVLLKTIVYLIKVSMEMRMKSYSKLNTYDILHEINELFLSYPPSNLREGLPNADFLNKIYLQIKLLVEMSIDSDKQQAKIFIDNSKKRNKTNYCEQFIVYLESIIYN